MNFLRDKRIKYDIKHFIKSDLNSNGIYCDFDEEDMSRVKALIIGPKDTPYENGFYFFSLQFPDNYPYSPPSVKFLTQIENIRFNPNLYVDGKVCLSILGTWAGPGWSSCLSLNSVLLSIQSLLNEYPLQNEPGFEKEKGTRSQNYNSVIEYFNIKGSTIKMLKTPPYKYNVFAPIMEKYFIENIDYYREYVKQNVNNNNIAIHSSVYSLNAIMNITYLTTEIEILFKKYDKSASDSASIMTVENPVKPVKQIKKRRCPNNPAKLYDIGFIKLSENDDKKYKVVEVSGPKRTMKRWVLYKNYNSI